jgi:hypothetical protein
MSFGTREAQVDAACKSAVLPRVHNIRPGDRIEELPHSVR